MLATRYRIGKPIKEPYHSLYTPMPKRVRYHIPLSRHGVRIYWWARARKNWISLRKVWPHWYQETDYYPKRVRIRRRNRSWVIWIARRIVRFPFKFKIKTRVKALFYFLLTVFFWRKYWPVFSSIWTEPLIWYF